MRRKYGNQKVNGFDSKKEAKRYQELCLLAKAGEIMCLECQPEWIVVPKTDKFRAVKYRADFRYLTRDGKYIVEDVKGIKTREFIIKQKLMYHVHGIEVKCV